MRILSAVAALGAAAIPFAAPQPVAAATAAVAAPTRTGQEVADFYRARDGKPLWFGGSGRQVEVLLELLESARFDGLNPRKYRISSLERAVRAARRGDSSDVKMADRLLSQALAEYARDLRRAPNTGMLYVDPVLRPEQPSPRAILEDAAEAPSLERYVAEMRWMHPLYGQLRFALMSGEYPTRAHRELIQLNLQRARELPATGRHVLVNTAAQRLYMYEDGQVVDSMRVVVGKPIYPTPMMAALIRYAALNPYWYVPPDLAAERIAPNVLREGAAYLKRQGYQVVSDFRPDPEIIDWREVDWQAVADGRVSVRVRQLPGPHNSMGRIKFMFPNGQGVYLHDNPERELFEEASRLYSGGCVRLEAAWRLSEWLFGRELTWKGARPEEPVPLEQPVPVYLTYLTAVPSGDYQLAFFDDVYGRDAAQLDELRSGAMMAARR